ncbi:MAG: NHL domain-containing protein [Bacteroidia bacterium]
MNKLLPLLFSAVIGTAGAQTISTFAGSGTAGFSGDGTVATSAQLHGPYGTCFDQNGNFYIADALNHRIRKISVSGIITTIAGNGAAGYAGDGSLATSAQLNRPTDVAVDNAGNIFIADELNNVIRKINTSGIITTYAGTGVSGFSGDGGLATSAQLTRPNLMTLDQNGNIYISLYQSNRVRKVSAAGIITTIAGNGGSGFSGDGSLATSATFDEPCKVAIDNSGNIFIADEYNQRIRKISSSGIISTVAGNGGVGFSGDGGLATSASLNYPEGIAVDALGNLYISDKLNERVRKVSTSGIITTIVGTGTQSYSGDGGLATSATMYYPEELTFDTQGNLYISDWGNNVIRKVTNVTVGVTEVQHAFDLVNVFPNPSTGKVAIEFAGTETAAYTLTDIMGNVVKSGKLSMTENSVDMEGFANGIYNLVVTQKEKTSVAKVILQK